MLVRASPKLILRTPERLYYFCLAKIQITGHTAGKTKKQRRPTLTQQNRKIVALGAGSIRACLTLRDAGQELVPREQLCLGGKGRQQPDLGTPIKREPLVRQKERVKPKRGPWTLKLLMKQGVLLTESGQARISQSR